jgi:hypothetical protein
VTRADVVSGITEGAVARMPTDGGGERRLAAV